MSHHYLFIHEDPDGRTLYAHPCGSGIALIIEQTLNLHSVVLDAATLARFIKSLAPVVGAEGGEQRADITPLPVASAEPGPDGVSDGPARASTEGDR